jgi:hypothetical protein
MLRPSSRSSGIANPDALPRWARDRLVEGEEDERGGLGGLGMARRGEREDVGGRGGLALNPV